MTEHEWLVCTNPDSMLEYLQGKASERKLRLFACACCRCVWRWIRRRELLRAVEASESFADGLISQKKLDAVEKRVLESLDELCFEAQTCMSKKIYAARDAASGVAIATAAHITLETARQAAGIVRSVFAWTPFTLQDQGALIRELIGNPFRPQPAIEPSWLSWNDGVVPKLSQAIYDDRAFDRLPILADALEEAGCNNADMLNHCRQRGEHVRGCWIIDLLLGKS